MDERMRQRKALLRCAAQLCRVATMASCAALQQWPQCAVTLWTLLPAHAHLCCNAQPPGRMPSDPEAFAKTKAALGVQLAGALTAACGAAVTATEEALEVLWQGFAFKLLLLLDRCVRIACAGQQRVLVLCSRCTCAHTRSVHACCAHHVPAQAPCLHALHAHARNARTRAAVTPSQG